MLVVCRVAFCASPLPCLLAPRCTVSGDVMSRHVTLCHGMSCHVISSRVSWLSSLLVPCPVVCCHAMSRHLTLCHVVSCHLFSCHALVISCCVMCLSCAGHVTSSLLASRRVVCMMSCHVTTRQPERSPCDVLSSLPCHILSLVLLPVTCRHR